MLHDYKNGQTYSSIQSLPDAKATLELHNSPLSEVACLGYEYGYAEDAREALVLWEAQFGDFGNGAQVIIDQFIVSGMAKWGQTSRLTLLLPHGYEGSGPEHSSARLERFLQLAAEGNIRVANLTTPAQYFHLLRAQALSDRLRPLVIMTPKSLLRLGAATNRIQHLSDTKFFSVLGEPRVDHEKVERLVLCTGKVYYDLVGHPTRAGNDRVAVGRVELLYPFPEEQLRQLVDSYPNLKRSCGSKRSRATWAPARTCSRASPRCSKTASCASATSAARARLARRGLPRRAPHGAEPDRRNRARHGHRGLAASAPFARRR